MQTQKTHWASLLTLSVLAISALGLFMLSAGMGIMSLIDFFGKNANPASGMISAFVFAFQMCVVLVCAWFTLRKTMERADADTPMRFPFSEWQIIAVFGMVLFALPAGGIIAYAEISWLSFLTLPLLTVLVIVPPIWLLLGIGTKGIELGPRWRAFGIFGLGLTFSPFIMIALEIIVLIAVMVVVVIFLAMQPNLLKEVSQLATILQGETNEEAIMQLIAPYLVKPGVIVTALVYVALLIPLIEELFKPLAVWLFARSIETPAQGFALGLLSGAAFALMESLNAGADGSASWSIVVGVRAGTSLLHITATGLVGWGIASAFRERKVLRLLGAYFCSVTIHGLWNACAIVAGVSSIAGTLGKPEWMFTIAPAAICGMVVLGLGMFVILIAANQRLRKSETIEKTSA